MQFKVTQNPLRGNHKNLNISRKKRAFSIKQKSFFKTFEMLSFGKIQKIEETSFKIKRIQGGLGADASISDITKVDLNAS